MKDRVPVYPGRVKLVPVSGQENVYDMTRADQPTQQGDPLNKATLLKDATAALFGLGTDAVPDDVLALLSKAAIKKTYATKKTLSDVSEGDVVWVIEGDTPAEYYVAKHNYESGLNGTGKTLLLRKEVHSLQQWNTENNNVFETSSIFQYLNSTFKNTLDPDVRDSIIPVKFYCTIGGGNNSVSTITGRVFLASAAEMGITSTPSRFNTEGTTFPTVDTLRSFDAYNSVYNAWTRSPMISSTPTAAMTQNYTGNTTVNWESVKQSFCVRPCFALPSTFNVYVDKPVTGLYDVSDNLLLKLPGVQIATGSYVGTGKYGSSNPNSLTFEFVPSIVFVFFRATPAVFFIPALSESFIREVPGYTILFSSSSGFSSVRAIAKFIGNTLSWYYDDRDGVAAPYQLNELSTSYSFIAIG